MRVESCRKGFFSVGKHRILSHNLVDLLRQLSRAFDNVSFFYSLLSINFHSLFFFINNLYFCIAVILIFWFLEESIFRVVAFFDMW